MRSKRGGQGEREGKEDRGREGRGRGTEGRGRKEGGGRGKMSESTLIPVKVAVRCRPLIQKEINSGCQMCVAFTPGEPQIVLGKDRAFTYDYVFPDTTDQNDVYRRAVFPLIKHIFKGYNGTVFAYGQTGSGKTYTMGGSINSNIMGGSLHIDSDTMGIIPRVLMELFKGIEEIEDSEFSICVSYLEVYNESINDLLCPPAKRQPLTIREDHEGIKLPQLKQVAVESYESTMRVLEMGSHSRTTGATAMNDTSSRSHAIFTIHIERKQKDDQDNVRRSKFHLVDLAGSERVKKTHAEGDRFKEGVNINKGLLALGNVISALCEESGNRSYIPYRDAKLTRLLQDSLGGNSYTLMIACISPADSNMEETLNTLRYADRARQIKNKPIINMDPRIAEIHRLNQLVQYLQEQLMQAKVRGEGLSTNTSTSTNTSMMSVDSGNSSAEEIKSLIEKNKLLEDENHKLSNELRRAVDQSTTMCEKNIRLEMKKDQLKQRLRDLKTDTGVDFELLGTSMDLESNPLMKEQFYKLKTLAENIKKEEPKDESNSDPVDMEEEEECLDGDDTPGTPDSRALSKQYALRQAKLNRQLQELNKQLEKKEDLANQMSENDSKMHQIREQYQSQMKELESEVTSLQKEKEDMQQALQEAVMNKNANIVAEQRRLRLKELEEQISKLRKKMTEQTRLLKMKDQSDKKVSKLNTDIQSLKQQRVKLMRQIKEDADEFRKWKQKKDKEVLQLQQKDRKRQFEIAKLQRENQKQQSVLKRKSEEALAANKRLKEALVKQKQVQQERSQKLEKCDSTNIGKRVRSWLSQEVEMRVSIREAKYHLESLLNDRKTLCGQLNNLKDQIYEESNGPPMKKLAWMAENGDRSESSFQTLETEKQIKELEIEVAARNVQISDLQQKIMDADQGIVL
ncbi:hypothetical protein FSP39_002071 [Pinctada imbricata]|uniref:Kinesin-like protein n=1 Tax=Pinctada imbricata TaxID=66713 RepID=A0AA88Y7B5_PINIB|nr:hypothetical protein FSP39_002071 [Pinctada imbricata]